MGLFLRDSVCDRSCWTNPGEGCANIGLQLRTLSGKRASKHYTFRPFRSLLGVLLHEITHIHTGCEDIHPPYFCQSTRSSFLLVIMLHL